MSFDIDESFGQLRTMADLSLDNRDSYTVTVSVSDGKNDQGNPDAASDATIEVTINFGSGPVTRPVFTGGVVGGGGGGGGGGPTPSTLEFEWNVTRDIEELDSGHGSPTGAWSDGTTLWLAENGDGADDAIYAYDLESGERVEEREFELDERNRAPRGVWSDSVTLWIADSGQDRLFAYDLESGERVEEREVEFDTRNRDPRGIWSDGTTVWVLDGGKNALFAYDLASGELLGEYELDSANDDPRGHVVRRHQRLGLRSRRQAPLRLPPAGARGARGRRTRNRRTSSACAPRSSPCSPGPATTALEASGPTAR